MKSVYEKVDVVHLEASYSGVFRHIGRGNRDGTTIDATPVPLGVLRAKAASYGRKKKSSRYIVRYSFYPRLGLQIRDIKYLTIHTVRLRLALLSGAYLVEGSKILCSNSQKIGATAALKLKNWFAQGRRFF